METKTKQYRVNADQQGCDYCGICVAVCPEDCIDLEPYRISIDHSLCTHCGFCISACPVEALQKSKHEGFQK